MAIHSSILAWKIPCTRSGGLQSIGSQRVRYDWVTDHELIPLALILSQQIIIEGYIMTSFQTPPVQKTKPSFPFMFIWLCISNCWKSFSQSNTCLWFKCQRILKRLNLCVYLLSSNHFLIFLYVIYMHISVGLFQRCIFILTLMR